MRPFLTIAIPTWNRADLLAALLEMLVPQQASAARPVEILIGDNGSSDHTPDVCRRFGASVRYLRHDTNRGFDGNVWSLYQAASGGFVLFFSDDDVPMPNLVESLVQLLESTSPDVLLFGFEQPLGKREPPSLGNGPAVEVLRKPAEAINAIVRYTKVSTYCVRRRELTADDISFLSAKVGTDYFFVSLALFVTLSADLPRCTLHRDALAGSRPDFNRGFRFPLDVAANFAHAVDVPGFREHAASTALRALHADRTAVLLNNLRRHYLGILRFTPDAVTAAETKRQGLSPFPSTALQAVRTLQYWNARYVRPISAAKVVDTVIERVCGTTLRLVRGHGRKRSTVVMQSPAIHTDS